MRGCWLCWVGELLTGLRFLGAELAHATRPSGRSCLDRKAFERSADLCDASSHNEYGDTEADEEDRAGAAGIYRHHLDVVLFHRRMKTDTEHHEGNSEDEKHEPHDEVLGGGHLLIPCGAAAMLGTCHSCYIA